MNSPARSPVSRPPSVSRPVRLVIAQTKHLSAEARTLGTRPQRNRLGGYSRVWLRKTIDELTNIIIYYVLRRHMALNTSPGLPVTTVLVVVA